MSPKPATLCFWQQCCRIVAGFGDIVAVFGDNVAVFGDIVAGVDGALDAHLITATARVAVNSVAWVKL